MIAARKSVIFTLTLLGATYAAGQNLIACANFPTPAGENMKSKPFQATAQRPAQFVPESGPNLVSSSPALRLSLRPTGADPNTPFLAQIIATQLCDKKNQAPGQVLGVVSFFPLNLGQTQEFVLPAPQQGFPSLAPQDVQLTVKLIPANPSRVLDNASVEVVGAHFAE